MSRLQDFVSSKLADEAITDAEVPRIRDLVYLDGKLDLDDVKVLVELYCNAQRCPAFEDLFFSVLDDVIRQDGQVQPSEQYFLLKMLYSDREITTREREFLQRLRQTVPNRSREFDSLCETALAAPATNWSVGGR